MRTCSLLIAWHSGADSPGEAGQGTGSGGSDHPRGAEGAAKGEGETIVSIGAMHSAHGVVYSALCIVCYA